MSVRLPSSTRPSGAIASIPCPGTVVNSLIGGSARPCSLARATIASPSGCSEPCSAAAASARTSSSDTEGAAITSVTAGLPTVKVPVLSSTATSHAGQQLERRRAPDQDTELGARAPWRP